MVSSSCRDKAKHRPAVCVYHSIRRTVVAGWRPIDRGGNTIVVGRRFGNNSTIAAEVHSNCCDPSDLPNCRRLVGISGEVAATIERSAHLVNTLSKRFEAVRVVDRHRSNSYP